MIGQFLAENTEEIFHVFLTPDTEQSHVIRINALENVKHSSAKFDKHDLFANTLITTVFGVTKIDTVQGQLLKILKVSIVLRKKSNFTTIGSKTFIIGKKHL
jgi:hypothetical protein